MQVKLLDNSSVSCNAARGKIAIGTIGKVIAVRVNKVTKTMECLVKFKGHANPRSVASSQIESIERCVRLEEFSQ